MPVATAITFLSEPPSSTPVHVVVRVDAEVVLLSASCATCAAR